MKEPVTITAVHLYLEGGRAVVAVEVNGRWVPVISEAADNCFSNIVEGRHIAALAKRKETP